MSQTAKSRKVRILRLHQSFLIEGFGNVDNLLKLFELKNGKAISGVVIDQGVLLTAHLNRNVDALVPWGNIVSAELFPEVTETSQAV